MSDKVVRWRPYSITTSALVSMEPCSTGEYVKHIDYAERVKELEATISELKSAPPGDQSLTRRGKDER